MSIEEAKADWLRSVGLKPVTIIGGRFDGESGRLVGRDDGMVVVDLEEVGCVRVTPRHVFHREQPLYKAG